MLTNEQFSALVRLAGMRGGAAQECMRLHYLTGMPLADAARQAGISYVSAHQRYRHAQGRIADAKLLAGCS